MDRSMFHDAWKPFAVFCVLVGIGSIVVFQAVMWAWNHVRIAIDVAD